MRSDQVDAARAAATASSTRSWPGWPRSRAARPCPARARRRRLGPRPGAQRRRRPPLRGAEQAGRVRPRDRRREARRGGQDRVGPRPATAASSWRRRSTQWLGQELEGQVYWVEVSGGPHPARRPGQRPDRGRPGPAGAALRPGADRRHDQRHAQRRRPRRLPPLPGPPGPGRLRRRCSSAARSTTASRSSCTCSAACPTRRHAPAKYEEAVHASIQEYVERTRGRAFVLFTSYQMMQKAADRSCGPGSSSRATRCSARATACRARRCSSGSGPRATRCCSASIASGRASTCRATRCPTSSSPSCRSRCPDRPLIEAPHRGDRGGRRRAVLRLPGAAGGHQAEAGLRPADPHAHRHRHGRHPRSAGADQGLRAIVSGGAAGLPPFRRWAAGGVRIAFRPPDPAFSFLPLLLQLLGDY